MRNYALSSHKRFSLKYHYAFCELKMCLHCYASNYLNSYEKLWSLEILEKIFPLDAWRSYIAIMQKVCSINETRQCVEMFIIMPAVTNLI